MKEIRKYLRYLVDENRLYTLLLPNISSLLALIISIINPSVLGTDSSDNAFRVILMLIMVLVPIFNTLHSIKTYKMWSERNKKN